MLFFNHNQTMIDLVSYSFLTIDSKLSVTLWNSTELDKVAWGQEVKGFHVEDGAQT
jgi:hypothetical protein